MSDTAWARTMGEDPEDNQLESGAEEAEDGGSGEIAVPDETAVPDDETVESDDEPVADNGAAENGADASDMVANGNGEETKPPQHVEEGEWERNKRANAGNGAVTKVGVVDYYGADDDSDDDDEGCYCGEQDEEDQRSDEEEEDDVDPKRRRWI